MFFSRFFIVKFHREQLQRNFITIISKQANVVRDCIATATLRNAWTPLATTDYWVFELILNIFP
jgi:hypothetical protein